jgi:hypothetical protein
VEEAQTAVKLDLVTTTLPFLPEVLVVNLVKPLLVLATQPLVVVLVVYSGMGPMACRVVRAQPLPQTQVQVLVGQGPLAQRRLQVAMVDPVVVLWSGMYEY